MKKMGFMLITILLVLAVASCASPAPKDVIELKMVAFTPPKGGNVTERFLEFVDRINEQTKGEMVINYIGGPEAVPAREQAEAVRKGIVDATCLPVSFYQSLLPEAVAYMLSTITPEEERKGGFWDFAIERHESINIYPVGRLTIYEPFYTMLGKSVTKSADLKGLRIGKASVPGNAFYDALGCTVTTIPNTEYYTSMERHVVDGLGYPLTGYLSFSLTEVAPYYIDHGYLARPNVLFQINLDTWKSLPSKLQKTLINMTKEFENERLVKDQGLQDQVRAAIKSKGVQTITFTPDDAKYYTDLAYSSEWEKVKQAAPDLYPELRKLLKQ